MLEITSEKFMSNRSSLFIQMLECVGDYVGEVAPSDAYLLNSY